MSDSAKADRDARSKILRLPFADRMEFNRLVRSGYKGSSLIEWLAKHGVAGVTHPNLTRYRHSPAYREWLAEESQVLRDQAAAERAMRLTEAIGGSASDKIKKMLAGALFRVMPGVDPTGEDASRFINALRAITDAERVEIQRGTLDLARERFQRQTCELFVKWYADRRAQDILDSPEAPVDEKVNKLGGLIFGEDWK